MAPDHSLLGLLVAYTPEQSEGLAYIIECFRVYSDPKRS